MELKKPGDENAARPKDLSRNRVLGGARKVAIVVFENFSLTEVSSIAEMFRISDELAPGGPEEPAYSVVVLSSRQALVPSGPYVQLLAKSTNAHDPRLFETVFVAGGRGARTASHDAELLSWLRQLPLHARVMGLAPGAEAILAMSGRATDNLSASHDACASDAAGWSATTPSARATGEIWGWGTVQYELAVDAVLSIVRSDLGASAALELERRVNSHLRMNFVDTTERSNAEKRILSERIAWSIRWINENSAQPVSVADLARLVSMSERNFLRRFKREIGQTPSEYLMSVRLNLARRLLVEGDLPLDKIARRCGLFNGDHLRKLFHKHFSISPADYRKTARGVLDDMSVETGLSRLCRQTDRGSNPLAA
ncbi:MAG: hypothetical protein QOI13_569 [Paraburkholderia sp.]|jgi:transcriptional regulator GlxA family with amidase domain|nr:hypothetical protein [Paraburkholderia sp.]